MNSSQEKMHICIVEVVWPGEKKWTKIEDPGDYALRQALEKCEIDGYRVMWREFQPLSLAPSRKMSNTIDKLEQTHGVTFKKDFFLGKDPKVCSDRDYYDCCILSDNNQNSLNVIVYDDGTYHKL